MEDGMFYTPFGVKAATEAMAREQARADGGANGRCAGGVEICAIGGVA